MKESLLCTINKKSLKNKMKALVLVVVLSFIFAATRGGSVSALDLSQESLEITGKSDTTIVYDAGIGDFKVAPKLEFNRLGDFVSYKMVIKNNDGKKYQIVDITDDNSNEAIVLTYSYSTDMGTGDKEIDFTVKYVKINDAPLQEAINVVVKIVDEDDASADVPIIIPNTGAGTTTDVVSAATIQSTIIYIVFAAGCFAVYIVLRKKKMEKGKRASLRAPKALLIAALLLGIVPVAVIAASFENIYFTVDLAGVKLNGPYVVFFDAGDGADISSQIVNSGDTVTPPSVNPTKDGYDFVGWVDEDGNPYDFDTPVSGPVKISADWKPITYIIAYDLAGGTAGTPANKTEYTIETPDFTLTNPTKEHYDFAGWTGTDLSGPTTTVKISQGSTDNRSYTATWKEKEYTATFDTDGGTPAIANQTKKYDETFTKPADPEKLGYEFKGWFLDDTAYDFATKVTKNIALKAKWEAVGYVVTFNANGGTPTPAAQTVKYQETATKPAEDPTRTGYNFKGWQLNGADYNFATEVTDNITLVAKWEKKEYTVTFDASGGTPTPAVQTVKYQETATKPEDPGKTGYTFKGWQLNNADYDFAAEVTGDITLVAKWEIIEYTISYKGLEGAMVNPANTATYTIKSDAITLNDAMKPGYTFDGWTGEGITTPTKGLTIPSGSIGYRTYTANWTIITYNINYAGLEDATVDPANKTTYDVNTETFSLTEPTKRGYTFTGWTSDSDAITTPTKTITIAKGSTGDRDYMANWVLTVFTITYDLDGGNVATANPTEYTMETETFEISNEPTKDGTYALGLDKYEFIGWTGEGITTPTKPVTITKGSVGNRKYKANYKHLFKVMFNPGDHGMITEFDRWVEEKTAVGAFPTVTVDPGYKFIGWYEDRSGEKAEDTYIVDGIDGFTARYEVIDYTISLDPNGGSYKGSTSAYTVGTYNIDSLSPVTVWEPSATDLGPTREGYRFTGWTGEGITTPTLGKVELTVSAGTLGNKTYTANWVKQWTVTFDSNGGSPVEPKTVDTGTEVSKPDDPTKTDYVFKGWKLNGADYNFNTPVTGDITLKAEWQVGKSTLSLDGKGMLTKMKQLANPSSGITNGYDYRDTRTKAFARANEAQYNAAVNAGLITDANKISTNDSIAATYMWFDSSTGTMYYYTEAAKIYINGSMDRMFAKYTNITDWSGLEDFDTSGATAMDRLFQDCPSFDDAALEYIKDWNTSNVRDMTFIFGANDSSKGNKITNVAALTNWDVSKVRSFYQAFKHATKLESLGELVDDPKNPGTQIYNGLGQWNVSSVGYESDTSVLPSNDNYGFAQMFNGCVSLTDADAIVDWNINSAVTSAVNAGKNRSWAFDGMLRNAPVRPTQPAFTSWTPGGAWSDTGTFNPNAAP